MNERATRYILALTIIAAVTAAYLTSFPGVFLFDDFPAILSNPNVVGPSPVFSGHRWLVDLTFRLNMSLGREPFYFHLVNLLVHMSSSLLLFGIVTRTLAGFTRRNDESSLPALFTGWAVGLLWAVHPLTTQAVTYVCQRYESMMAFFALGSLYAFIAGVESGKHERLWMNISLAAVLLGMGTKESMAVVPLLLLAYDHVFCEKSFHLLTRKRGLFHVAAFAGMLVLLMYQVQLAADQISGIRDGGRLGTADSFSYLYSQAVIIFHYLKLSIWPAALCFDYSWRVEPVSLAGILAMVTHAALFLYSVYGVFRRKPWGFLVMAFYVLLAPTSSFVPVADLATEHRMYLPLIPIVIAAVVLIREASCRTGSTQRVGKKGISALFVVAVVCLAVVLGLATSARNMYYWSETAMWQDVCAKRPDNLRARNDLASSLSVDGARDEALMEYHAVIDKIPEDIRARCDRGEAMVFDRFIKSSPEYAYFVACANLGTMYCNEMRDYDQAFDWYLRALRIAPGSPDVRRSARNILRSFGHAEDDLDAVLNAAINKSIIEQRN